MRAFVRSRPGLACLAGLVLASPLPVWAQKPAAAPAAAAPPAPAVKVLSWLPTTSANDAVAAKIPPNARLSFRVPKDDPLKFDASGGGWGNAKIDTLGRITPTEPTDKKSYKVTGGTLVSSLGAIEKRAKYGDWEFAFEDAARTKKVGWGYCLTAGELLLPRSMIANPPLQVYGVDAFEVTSFGKDYLLVKLDPKKAHRFCFVQRSQGGEFPSAGGPGTRIEVAGKLYERRVDGWYLGATKVPD